MMLFREFFSLMTVLLLMGCVTINVYFPAKAAEKAADTVIEEVWGRNPEPTPGKAPPAPSSRRGGDSVFALGKLVGWLVPEARAQDVNINVSSPAIERIKESMKRRHPALLPYFESGAAGLTADGLVAVRDLGAIPLKERRRANELVADENRDRVALYGEIARVSGHPEWETDIRSTFARRWVANARRGWWYQSREGWTKKR